MTRAACWLLLIHRVPTSPPYLRVRIWRRLQQIGAVPLKNAVYVLPRLEESKEKFHWIVSEIMEGGGEACVCEARFVEGISVLFEQLGGARTPVAVFAGEHKFVSGPRGNCELRIFLIALSEKNARRHARVQVSRFAGHDRRRVLRAE